MITLYGFGPAWGLPDLSPFVVKVDCYLRMAGLPYELVALRPQDLPQTPKGKLPYIDDNGHIVADSSFIVDYRQATYADPLGDYVFSARDQAIARSLRVMMEEHLNWVTGYARWLDEGAWEEWKRVAFKDVPPDQVDTLATQVRETTRGYLYAQGMGRHSRADIYALGNGDLSALAAYLEQQPYFLGEQPSAVDAAAYGILSHILYVGYESPHKTHLQSLANLVAYCHRMRERYYPGGP